MKKIISLLIIGAYRCDEFVGFRQIYLLAGRRH